jgi:transposase InsO family protein
VEQDCGVCWQLIINIRGGPRGYGALTIYLMLKGAIDRRAQPAVSTIDLILKRHGLVKKRRRVRRLREVHPVFVAPRPNVIWSADFKGKFRTGDKQYCYPLTVMDTYSRYVLAIAGMRKPTFEGTKAAFDALLGEYGLPEQIHTDNGEPFCSAQRLSGLSRLAVWFMNLGTVPVYSDPGHPVQNPERERMHTDLKAAATGPVAWNLAPLQRKFEGFRRQHNEVRPHQSL